MAKQQLVDPESFFNVKVLPVVHIILFVAGVASILKLIISLALQDLDNSIFSSTVDPPALAYIMEAILFVVLIQITAPLPRSKEVKTERTEVS